MTAAEFAPAIDVSEPCGAECVSHRCDKPCGRRFAHPDDFASCICDDCASALIGWFW